MEHVIIVNPVAGRGNNLKYGLRIQKLLKKYNIDSTIFLSEYPGHITEYVKELSKSNTYRLYSVGGDGTLNEIVTGIIGTDSEIVVVPCGTGNDFVKCVSKYKSMRKIIISSITNSSQKVDILKVGKDKYCINILSAGFDSIVAKNLDIFRKVPLITGKFKYSLAIIYTLFFSRNFKFKIRINDNIILKHHFTLAVVANGKYYGGGVMPCPDANIQDSKIDICIADNTTFFEKLILLPKYKKGKHGDLKQINFFKTDKINIVSTRQFPANIDGEVFYTNKLSISIIPNAVNIVFC
jgi:YegS/Rv2252/BmrU family lipid kinase